MLLEHPKTNVWHYELKGISYNLNECPELSAAYKRFIFILLFVTTLPVTTTMYMCPCTQSGRYIWKPDMETVSIMSAKYRSNRTEIFDITVAIWSPIKCFVFIESHITGTPHPVHIHGHQLEVIKVGYPTYNDKTGKFQNFTSDIFCESNSLCNQASWADPSWSHGNIPGILTEAAPRKDTLSIPGGGYVVVRFR